MGEAAAPGENGDGLGQARGERAEGQTPGEAVFSAAIVFRFHVHGWRQSRRQRRRQRNDQDFVAHRIAAKVRGERGAGDVFYLLLALAAAPRGNTGVMVVCLSVCVSAAVFERGSGEGGKDKEGWKRRKGCTYGVIWVCR